MLPHILPLIEGRTWAWELSSADGWQFSYKMREAMKIALIYPHDYPRIAAVAEAFEFHVMNQGKRVEARRKKGAPNAATVSVGGSVNERATPIHGLGGLQRTDIALVGLATCVQVVASWMKQAPIQEPMYFTETKLSDEEKSKLYQWCKAQTPRKMFFVDETERTLTLSIAEEETEEFSWHPGKPAPIEEEFDL
jgi:hypothetical protein